MPQYNMTKRTLNSGLAKTLFAVATFVPFQLNCDSPKYDLTEREQKYVKVLKQPLNNEQRDSLSQIFPELKDRKQLSYNEAVVYTRKLIEKENKASEKIGKNLGRKL